MKAHAVSYPLPCFGHHPNFKGAAKAATLLLELLLTAGRIKPGQTVLCYPDYVLKGLRKGLLEAGLNVIVPAQHGGSYRLLESASVHPAKASSIRGAEIWGQSLEVLPQLHFAFVACVAMSFKGETLDKGYGYRLPDLPLTIATIVHPLQILESCPEVSRQVAFYATSELAVKV